MKLKSLFVLCSLFGLAACENEAPDITSTAVTEAKEDTYYSYTLAATDKDNDKLTWSFNDDDEGLDWLKLEAGFDSDELFDLANTSIKARISSSPLLSTDPQGNMYYLANDLTSGELLIVKSTKSGVHTVLHRSENDYYISSLLYADNHIYFSRRDISVSGGQKFEYTLFSLDLNNLSAGAEPILTHPSIEALAFDNNNLYVAYKDEFRGTITKLEKLSHADTSQVVQIRSFAEKEYIQAMDFSSTHERYQLMLTSVNGQYVMEFRVYNGDNAEPRVKQIINPKQCSIAIDVQINPADEVYIRCINNSLNSFVYQYDVDNNSLTALPGNFAVGLGFDTDGVPIWVDGSGNKAYKLKKLPFVLFGTPDNDDVGEYEIEITVSDGEDKDTQEFTLVVANTNDVPQGAVTITGEAKQGVELTATHNLTDDDGLGEISYQWYRQGEVIEDATAETYLATQQDVGKELTVVASYTDQRDTDEAVTSEAVVPVNVNDEPTGSVTLSGGSEQGQTLTASNDIADIDGIGTINYQWYRNDELIDGATNSTYVLTQLDVGATIKVVATYQDGAGTKETVVSEVSDSVVNINDVPTGMVSIDGTFAEYETLSINNTLDDADGLGVFSYEWKAGDSVIASTETYDLTANEIGKTITVTVSYQDGFGKQESVTSDPSIAVINTNDLPEGVVTISGVAEEEQILTATNNLTDVDGMGTVSYQWYAGGNAITNATNSTLVLTSAEVGSTITVVATYVDGFDTTETVSSLATEQVIAKPVNYTNVQLSDISNGNGGVVVEGSDFMSGQIGDVIAAGDINNDGIQDLILGAPKDNMNDGVIYVVFGTAEGLSADFNVQNVGSTVAGFKIVGEAGSSSNLGWALTYAGDINGDGFGDLVAGAPGIFDDSFNIIGRSYVIFGKDSNSEISLDSLEANNAGFAILSGTAALKNGHSVAAAGDVNGDGTPDVLIGAHGSDNANGAAYVVFGKSTSSAVDLGSLESNNQGFAMNGDFLANAGYALTSVGDINNDGKADIMVAAPGDVSSANTKGYTYIVLGKASSTAITLSDLLSGGSSDALGYAIIGEKNDDFSGDFISALGDVNGDGINDMAITASFWSPDGMARPGRSYVVFGKTDMTSDITLTDVVNGTGGFVIDADVNEDIHLGAPVIDAGDVNGDGYADIGLGAYGTDPFVATGAAYVVFGKADTTKVAVTDLIAETGGFQINGVADSQAGRGMANVGDINGDGKTDIAVGAPGIAKIYIVYGK